MDFDEIDEIFDSEVGEGHHAIVVQIEGSSYRLRQHADLVPEQIRSNATVPSITPVKRRGRPPKHGGPDRSNG